MRVALCMLLCDACEGSVCIVNCCVGVVYIFARIYGGRFFISIDIHLIFI